MMPSVLCRSLLVQCFSNREHTILIFLFIHETFDKLFPCDYESGPSVDIDSFKSTEDGLSLSVNTEGENIDFYSYLP